jgi:hypothetical protein
LVRDERGVVPLQRANGAPILSISVARRADLSAGLAFNAELRRLLGAVRAEFVAAEDIAVVNRARLVAMADSSSAVVLSYYVGQSWDSRNAAAPPEFVELVTSLQAGARPFVVASFGNPYLLQQTGDVGSYLVAWGGAPVSQLAAARALAGERPVGGRLPISIPPFAEMGAGLDRAGR